MDKATLQPSKKACRGLYGQLQGDSTYRYRLERSEQETNRIVLQPPGPGSPDIHPDMG
jgi:hypothetical protein